MHADIIIGYIVKGVEIKSTLAWAIKICRRKKKTDEETLGFNTILRVSI